MKYICCYLRPGGGVMIKKVYSDAVPQAYKMDT